MFFRRLSIHKPRFLLIQNRPRYFNNLIKPKILSSNSNFESLKIAHERCSKKMFRILIKNGIDINTKDENGKTILMVACEDSINDKCPLTMVITLIDLGADINYQDANGLTPLMHAINNTISGYYRAELLLKNKKINLELKDNTGKTALDYVNDIMANHPKLCDNYVKLLLDHGLKIDKN